MITKEMEKMVEFIKNMESEEIKKGLKDFFNILEEQNRQIEKKDIEINDKKCEIEKLIQEKNTLKIEMNQNVFTKLGNNIKLCANNIKDIIKSEKSGM